MQRKNIYVVLGLARSGRSTITKSLQALGVGLEESLKPAYHFNPKGFWEDIDITYGINRAATYINGSKMITAERLIEPSPIGAQLQELLKVAENLLYRRFNNCIDWGFKDIRTGEMLPFWQTVFSRMDLNEHYLIAIRHPLARAYSNNKFNGQDLEYGLISWLEYMVRVVDQTHGKNRVVISYELMLQQPDQQLKHMRDTLKVGLECDSVSIDIYTKYFFDKKRPSHSLNYKKLAEASVLAVSPLCLEVYELLLRSARGELSMDSEEFLLAWQQIKLAYLQVEPIYQYINNLLEQRKNLQQQLKTIKKSLPWRLIYPLRVIDDFFRKRRLIKREQKRWQHAT